MLLSQLGIVENGMLWRVWGVTRDITDFKHVKRALDASKQHMINLLKVFSFWWSCWIPVARLRHAATT